MHGFRHCERALASVEPVVAFDGPGQTQVCLKFFTLGIIEHPDHVFMADFADIEPLPDPPIISRTDIVKAIRCVPSKEWFYANKDTAIVESGWPERYSIAEVTGRLAILTDILPEGINLYKNTQTA